MHERTTVTKWLLSLIDSCFVGCLVYAFGALTSGPFSRRKPSQHGLYVLSRRHVRRTLIEILLQDEFAEVADYRSKRSRHKPKIGSERTIGTPLSL